MIMKNTFKIFLGCAVLVSALTAGTVRSQGTAGASQLLIPVGTETVALSGTNVGTVAGIDALFTNVAGLARHNSGLQGTKSCTRLGNNSIYGSNNGLISCIFTNYTSNL
jgi:hypothetical protein